MRRRLAATSLLAAMLAGCSPEIPTGTGPPPGVKFLQITGEWVYTATEVRRVGRPAEAPCRIDGVVLTLQQIPTAGAFTGRSSGGALACSGDLAFLSGPITPYRIDTGYTFNEFVSFDLGSPDWRHEGLVTTSDSTNITSMSGSFRLQSGGVEFEGKFSAARR